MLRVSVICGFEPLRMGLVSIIAASPDFEIVAEAAGLEDLVGRVDLRSSDVIVVDATVLSGARRVSYAQITEWVPDLKVLFLGSYEDALALTPDDLPAYLRLNAVGFLLKDGPTERLLDAIRLIAAGTFVCETELIRLILTRLARWAAFPDEPEVEHEQALTAREMEVLRLVVRGCSNNEIAQELFLSEGTVKAHVSHIMSKLGLDRRTDVVRYALSRGMVPLDEIEAAS
jgi:DNA-binding NarL/FixJ family response regulator